MVKIKVGARGSAYFSDDLRCEGYVGELDAKTSACVLVIIRPGSSFRDAIRSLDIVKADFRHRMDLGEARDDSITPAV